MYVYSCPINNLIQSYILFDYPELHQDPASFRCCLSKSSLSFFLSFDRLSLQIRQEIIMISIPS